MNRRKAFMLVLGLSTVTLVGTVTLAFAGLNPNKPAQSCCNNHAHETDMVNLTPLAVCSACNGSGNGSLPCSSCRGSGRQGSFTCNVCNGRGRSKCPSCGGSGQK